MPPPPHVISDPVDAEIAKGRLWRAKEILRGRLVAADYEAALFERLAGVLAAMHDDDEAGRYYLLAGRTEAGEGALARAFLRRRAARSFAALWSDMPAAARRGDSAAIPPGTLMLLDEAGFDARTIKSQLVGLRRQGEARRQLRKRRLSDLAAAARGERIGLAMAAILLVILSVGIIGTLRLIWRGLAWLLGLP